MSEISEGQPEIVTEPGSQTASYTQGLAFSQQRHKSSSGLLSWETDFSQTWQSNIFLKLCLQWYFYSHLEIMQCFTAYFQIFQCILLHTSWWSGINISLLIEVAIHPSIFTLSVTYKSTIDFLSSHSNILSKSKYINHSILEVQFSNK